ncbi:tripartite tricarboxylate transporter substrate binding protein (plasmid) [Diaphorobacter sp. HDW4B]|uniref:Bug family tripartite tricarboxylate transporter substrate binding protein n=1 Tax=Diaphorobacter sp. HDW4B TaxID=2714925 RepID=UPI001407D9AC|nr:tripartite tricarboxylate transporter substrate binding protein [Diaphorobacter sp. HDW4B]QIL73917.1 tripartite tricarboxylate transporter substrate binding protein [Diaphorobacter sp. HDW4B]
MKNRFSQERRMALSLLASAGAVWATGGNAYAATNWPQKMLRLIVPYPASGVSDIIARLMAQRLASALGQSIVVDNRPGAAGTMGIDTMVKTGGDGNTFAFTPISPITLSPHLMKVGFDPMKDIAPVAPVMYSPVYVCATEAFKGKTLGDAIAQAKSGSVTMACLGFGSVGHIMIEQLRRQTASNLVPVPYKGDSQLLPDAVGAQFDILMINPSEPVNALIQRGKLRVIAVGSPERLQALPSVPTLAELGHAEAIMTSLFGFVAPASISPEAVQRLNAEVNRLLMQPELRERVQKLDNVALSQSALEFGASLRSAFEQNGKIVKQANIKAE